MVYTVGFVQFSSIKFSSTVMHNYDFNILRNNTKYQSKKTKYHAVQCSAVRCLLMKMKVVR